MNSQLPDRIREAAKLVGGIRALSEISGVSERTLNNWLSGTEPKVVGFAAIARAAGVDVGWLATGEGEMRPGTPAAVEASPAPLDERLMGRCVDAVHSVHKELRISLAPVELGRLAALIYADAVAATDDPDERLVAVKVGAQRLRREAMTAPPGTEATKASA